MILLVFMFAIFILRRLTDEGVDFYMFFEGFIDDLFLLVDFIKVILWHFTIFKS